MSTEQHSCSLAEYISSVVCFQDIRYYALLATPFFLLFAIGFILNLTQPWYIKGALFVSVFFAFRTIAT